MNQYKNNIKIDVKKGKLSKIKFSDMGENKIIHGVIIDDNRNYIVVLCEKNRYEINKKYIFSIKTSRKDKKEKDKGG